MACICVGVLAYELDELTIVGEVKSGPKVP